MKTNTYDSDSDTLRLGEGQVAALADIEGFWERTFRDGETRYGFLPGTIPTEEERKQIGRFFFWTAWVASTARPGSDHSYTNNWPPDRAVGNVATTQTYIWSIAGIISLFVTLGLFIFWVHRDRLWYGRPQGVPLAEKLVEMPLTSSQMKAAKYFLVVILLFLLQTSFGGLLAHYTVHPGSFYIPLIGKLIPYSWAKSWHLQLAIFWIATTWVASAIYLAPIIGGREPKGQGVLVQASFWSDCAGCSRELGRRGCRDLREVWRPMVLVWTPGLGISRIGTAVANSAFHRTAGVALHCLPRGEQPLDPDRGPGFQEPGEFLRA